MGTAQSIIMAVITHRPPNLSVSIPTGRRITDPTKTGAPKSHPICTEVHRKIALSTRNVTITPLNIHAAKQTVNATVLNANIRCERLVTIVSIWLNF